MNNEEVEIVFLMDYFTYKAGQVLYFNQNDINIVVGDNGAGKSTLIKMLQSRRLKQLVAEGYVVINNLKNQKGFVNIAEGFRVTKSQFVDTRKEVYISKLNQKSHGEAWKIELEAMKKKITPESFIMLDEPETALSIKSQVDLCQWIIETKRENPNLGALIATHSPIIQELIGETVIVVPDCERIPAQEYVSKQNDYINEVKKNGKMVIKNRP